MSDEQSQPLRSRQGAESVSASIPIDIIAGWCLLGVGYLAATFFPGTPLQAAVAAPVLFFLPGYVTVAAAFPHHHAVARAHYANRVTIGERLGLSFGLSLLILPILGLVAAALPWGLTMPVLGALLGGYVVALGSVAGFNRLRIPPGDRFYVPVSRWAGSLGQEFERSSATERMVTLALCFSVLLAVGVAGYALAVPNDGEEFTDFHVVTETDGGDYVAANYPTELTQGESATYTVGVENHEERPVEYEVVVTLDRVVEGDGGQQVIETDELVRMDTVVDPGEQWYETHAVTPQLTGENLRLTYHLYRGDAPERVDRDSAYRHVHVWVDVDG